MAKITSTGVKLYAVAGKPATVDVAGFQALSFAAGEIGEVTSIGAYGATVQIIESNPLATGVTEKRHGFTNFGSVPVSVDFDGADDGQNLMEAALELANKNNEYSFAIEFADGSVDFFYGLPSTRTKNPGGANSMVTGEINLEINSPVIKAAGLTA